MDNSVILEKIYINGKLHHDVLKDNFFSKRGIQDVREAIFNNTSFLDSYDTSFRERIFYIENGYVSVQLCTYCNTNKLKFRRPQVPFNKTCTDSNCISKHRTKVLLNSWDGDTKFKNKRIRYIDTICRGCGVLYRRSEQSKKRYCGQHCWTVNGDYVHTESTKEKIRNSNKLVHNSISYKEKYKDVYIASRKKISETMKRKIASGEFTPCITNSWTRWTATLIDNSGIKKFRSMWEAAFYSLNLNCKYEVTRISYTFNNTSHVYIVDFTDDVNKVLYEIKPLSLIANSRNVAKYEAAMDWCAQNDYTYVIIDDNWYRNNESNFDLEKYPDLEKVIKSICKKK